MNVMKKLLNEIAEVSAGQGAPQGDENYSIDGTPFVKAGNLHDLINGESIDLIQKVNDDIASKYRLKKFPAGTVVFAKSGMSCLKGYVYVLPTEAYVVNHLACIVPYFGLSEYLKFYFMHNKPSELIRDSSYPSIRLSDISDIVINLPELSECMDIVKILKNTERVIKIKKLQLLEFDQLIKSRFVEMFGDPITNNKGWDVKDLNEITDVRDGTHDSPKYVDIGYPFVTSKNLVNGNIDFSTCQLISKDDLEKINQRSFVDDGDILMPMIGTIGGAIIVKKDRDFAIKNVALIKFNKENSIVDRKFILNVLNSDSMNEFFNSIKKGGTQNFISLGLIRKIPTIIPPLKLQNEFALFVEQVDKLKFAVQKSLDETQTLFDSLMQKYFG